MIIAWVAWFMPIKFYENYDEFVFNNRVALHHNYNLHVPHGSRSLSDYADYCEEVYDDESDEKDFIYSIWW
jgi:hypothetical protein